MAFEYQFPDPLTAEPDGLLAVGGDLSVKSLITAYSQGIFPWFDQNSPILWWSPDPRMVLFPSEFKVTSSLKQRIRSKIYTVSIDTCFEKVIMQCAITKRKAQEGTWITDEMMQAYIDLHKEGIAHSFETWYNDILIGGLYGVSLGRAFFGESMFFNMRDASKVALFTLVDWCKDNMIQFIDAQQSTAHLKSMGARDISRHEFLKILNAALKHETIKGNWGTLNNKQN